MSEVKSTIDLVMERTKGMLMSEEERRAIQIRESAEKANGILMGLREARIAPDELDQVLSEEEDEDKRTDLRRALLRAAIDDLALDRAKVMAEILAALAPADLAGLIDEFERLSEEYARRHETMNSGATGNAIQDLAAIGISGSALKPKMEADPAYQENLSRLNLEFQSRLDLIRTAMLEKTAT